jgi:hypothetical protein
VCGESTVHAQQPPPGPDCTPLQIRTKFAQNAAPEMRGCEVTQTIRYLNEFSRKANITATSGPPPAGTILTQLPLPGQPAPAGTVFDLSYSDGKPVTEVGNLTVSMTLEPRGPYSIGETLKYWIVVGNRGTAESPSIRVDMATANLGAITVTGGCTGFPCQTIPLPADSNMSIFVEARIVAPGAFAIEVRISSTPTDQNADDNVTRIDEFAPAEAEPPPRIPSRADISVSVREQPGARHQEGNDVDYAILVTNRGPARATQVSVDITWDNISLTQIGGACELLPCTVDTIAPNESVEIALSTRLDGPEDFRGEVRASAAQPDPDASDNVAVFRGVALPRLQLAPWVAVAVAVVVVLGTAGHMLRRAHWLRLIEVVPSLESSVTPSTDSLAFAAPSVELKAWLEAGAAQPTSDIPFTRRKV